MARIHIPNESYYRLEDTMFDLVLQTFQTWPELKTPA